MPLFRALLLSLILVTAARAADWPQWLGPNRDGVSTEKVAPWKKAPERVWAMPVGDGHSSPIVADGKVFLHYGVKGKNAEEVAAFDAKTGKKLWSTQYERVAFESPFGYGPRGTPAHVDGKLYTLGVTGVLCCFDAKEGKILWQIDTLKKYEAPNLTFGVSCSPLIDGDNVIVMVGKGATVVAFERTKGTEVWKSLEDPASYSSPVLFGTGKDKQVVLLTQQGVVGLDPASGKEFWRYKLVDLLSESSTTPVKMDDVIFASSVTFGGVGLKMETKEGKPATAEVWKSKPLTCYFSTPVVADKHLYAVTGQIVPPQANLRCVDPKTGKVLWTQNKVGKYHAALLRTGNDKLLMLDDGGGLALLEPDAKGFKEVCRSKVSGPTWAHPALANGLLYLRDAKELICLKMVE
ncbi:MAG: PQQ-binding-like beta-propeller repeat protein [Gemmataceae bacterium]